MDHVVHGDDPCADEPGHDSRPAIETVVRVEDGADEAPLPDDGDGCKVWGPGRLTHVTVRGAKAYAGLLGGGREVASVDRDGTLFRSALVGSQEVGEVRCGKLVLTSLAEDRIVARIERGAVITTGLLGRSYARGAACSERQAAVGAYALMVLEETKQADDEAKQRKAKEDALRQQQQDTLRRENDEDLRKSLSRRPHP
jgi:hypothetical protein